ncbi:MAG: PIG-L family deacetylase [Actinomycetota bacterium]|nr:PIG-L family deacetylase [Actinomycetota bacterium]
MKKHKKNIITAVLSIVFIVLAAIGTTYLIEPSLYEFYKDIEITKEDRILILSPHPDDETICCNGIIQKAVSKKAKVKIVFLTNGDNNQLAFLLYSGKPKIFKKSYIVLGQTRRLESLKANKIFGLNENDLIFLGYPDNGTLNIMLDYWDTKIPFKNTFSMETKVPYKESYSPGEPYIGESILRDLEDIIKDYNPTKIFVSSPLDLNKDHRAFYLFLQVALWDLKDKIDTPEIFTYLLHAKEWPQLTGYHPSKRITHPDFLDGDDMEWHKVDLAEEEVRLKYRAISSYRSQVAYNPRLLFSFARADEIFAKFAEIHLEDLKSKDIGWHKSDIFRDGAEFLECSNFKDIYYSVNNKNLLIKISLHDLSAKNINGNIYILGYKKDKNFSKMPKIHIKIGRAGFKIYDKKKLLANSGIDLIYDENDLEIKVPLSVLGEPAYVLNGVETREEQPNNYASDNFLWRVINLK